MRALRNRAAGVAILAAGTLAMASAAGASPEYWESEWPNTDFTRTSVDFDEILSGGPPKDGIPAIDDPSFKPVREVGDDVGDREPVIAVAIGGDARAYPFSILMWHEIVNDEVGGLPISVTYCPLCNSAIVFDRRAAGQVLDFGVTGKLRRSDLLMYDRQTESWWQQFLGVGIVGEMTGVTLARLPARMESYAAFRKRHPRGFVLTPNNRRHRSYGRNPYVAYDSATKPMLYRGDFDDPIEPLSRVVAVGAEAWALSLVRARGRIETADLVITWSEGQASALDSSRITEGREVGDVVVRRKTDSGLEDAVYGVPFAFAWRAFHPNGKLHAPEE